MKTHYVAVTNREDFANWLQGTLGPNSEVAIADLSSPDRVLQLVDATGTTVVFVTFVGNDLLNCSRIVERLMEAKPYLAVVAIAEERDEHLLLSAMRAGARDFITVGTDSMEVQGVVGRLLDRVPNKNSAAQGRMFTVLSGRPGENAATLATHLALAFRERLEADRKVLLLDLGMPSGDTLLFLDMKPSYTFTDAIRSVRRFDETLIKSAFAQHRSGLSVLPMSETPFDQPMNISLSDALVLIGILKNYFDVVVTNLGGIPYSDFLYQMVDRSERTLLLGEQSVASINANRRLVDFLAERGVDLQNVDLVLDRYLPKLDLSAEKIAEVLSLPLLTTLPSQGLERLGAMNAGYSVFEFAPNSPYARSMKKLVTDLTLGERVDLARKGIPLTRRLFGGRKG